MEDITKFYSISLPGLMRKDSDPMQSEDMCEMPIAMAYVPRQVWRDKYPEDKGFLRGTIFAELDKPFKGDNR